MKDHKIILDQDFLTWCRIMLLKENNDVDQQKADKALHGIMNYHSHQQEY